MDIEDNSPDSVLTPPPGTLHPSWLDGRCLASADMRGRFCAVSYTASVASLRPIFLNLAVSLGLEDFDAAALKDSRPRALTQAIAQHLWDIENVDGVEYASRHGDENTLWGIFEKEQDAETSSCLSSWSVTRLSPNDADLHKAFSILGLRWDDQTAKAGLPPSFVEVDETSAEKKLSSMLGDSGATPFTPVGAAVLFWMAIKDPILYRNALEYLVLDVGVWGDFSDCRFLGDYSIAEHVEDSDDDPNIKHVKFVNISGGSSVVLADAFPVSGAAIVTLVRPTPAQGEWKIWGITIGYFPKGQQVRGDGQLNPVSD